MNRVFWLLSIIIILNVTFISNSQIDVDVVCPEGTNINLTVAAGAVGRELELTNILLNNYMELCPNIRVQALESPSLATDRTGTYIQFLGMRSDAVDIYQIDVTHPGIFAEHMVDLYEYAAPDSETIQQHFAPIIVNNTVDGKLVGMPWFTDVGLLYYRTDLLEKYELEAPTTWQELETSARIIQEGERSEGNSDFWGYVWQGNIGEPATINALEWQASSGGGVIINAEGGIEVNNRATIDAINRAAGWIGVISPEEVTGHAAEASRAIWQAGNAAFMRNWPYAYNLGNAADSPIAGNFAVSALPAGTEEGSRRTGVLGGWQLAVSRYSRNPDAAVSLVLYMTSYEAQKLRAIELSQIPTIQAMSEDAEVLEALPVLPSVLEALNNATPRPSTISGARYNDVSRLYSAAVYAVLRGEEDARTAMEDLEFDLRDLLATSVSVVPDTGTVIAQEETTPDDDSEGEETDETTPEIVLEEITAQTAPSDDDNSALLIIGLGVVVIAALGGFFVFSKQKS